MAMFRWMGSLTCFAWRSGAHVPSGTLLSITSCKHFSRRSSGEDQVPKFKAGMLDKQSVLFARGQLADLQTTSCLHVSIVAPLTQDLWQNH